MTMKITGADLFSAGTWNGKAFTESDIDSIVNSFVALDLAGRVPLKLTHEGEDPRSEESQAAGKLSFGWVQRIWRDGETLKGDLEVPDAVGAAINEGYIKFVSVELLKNVQADTRRIPWVLDAVALLGAEQPAVGVMNSLQALAMKRVPSKFSCEQRATFSKQDRINNSGDRKTMTDEEIKALREQLAKTEATLNAERAEFTRKETARIETQGRKTLEAVKALFNKAVSEEDILPAVRESFMRWNAPKEDNLAAWAEFNIVDAESAIKDNPKPGKKTFSKKTGRSGESDDNEFAGMDKDAEITARIKKMAFDRKEDLKDQKVFDRLALEVFSRNKELAADYIYLPETRESAFRAAK